MDDEADLVGVPADDLGGSARRLGGALHRSIVQAVIRHHLIVNDTGGQTRAFIKIRYPCHCIRLALGNPPQGGERVWVLSQMAETPRIRHLSSMICHLTGSAVAFLDTPRNEAEDNDLHV